MKSRLRWLATYVSVSALAAGLLLFDTWPRPPAYWLHWLALFVLVAPVILLGEFLSHGMLSHALAAALQPGAGGGSGRSGRVLYFVGLCTLFATTAVSVFEWTVP